MRAGRLTASPEEIELLRTQLASRGVELSGMRLRNDGTLGGSEPTLLAMRPGGMGAVPLSDEHLELGVVLGRGGMGLVRSATQRSLRREVAVKTAPEAGDLGAQSALLKEAWAAGAIEHPNVVPVHTLARAEGGAAVVMKRIAGPSWLHILEHPAAYPRFAGKDGLDAHVRVLLSVCNAVSFAHARGILHLDLKPENVMIGDLGEVYVLDWGLAARSETGPEWLTPARELKLPAGTPGYMAPELACGAAEHVDARTDVYLLGAMLHHVLTGAAPHLADSLDATLARASLDDPPVYGPEVPRELAVLLRRAMARAPDDRFPTVESMKTALSGFLRHRGAEHFRARAEERILAIDARLDEGTKGDTEVDVRLAESDFAIEQVRREWAEHPLLAELERELLVRRARHAIVDERLEAARALARSLDPVPVAVAAGLSALERKLDRREQHVRALEAMGRELDLSLGSAERRRIFAVLGLAWTLVSAALCWLDRTPLGPIGYRELLVEGALLVLTLAPYGWMHRKTYLLNRANRRLYGGLTFTAVAVEAFWVAAWSLHVPVRSAVAITPFFYGYAFATLGLALDRRLLLGVATFGVTGALSALAPEWAYLLIGLGGGATVAAVLSAWRTTQTP